MDEDKLAGLFQRTFRLWAVVDNFQVSLVLQCCHEEGAATGSRWTLQSQMCCVGAPFGLEFNLYKEIQMYCRTGLSEVRTERRDYPACTCSMSKRC